MTTEMQTPYELFAYQVGQDMNTLCDGVGKQIYSNDAESRST